MGIDMEFLQLIIIEKIRRRPAWKKIVLILLALLILIAAGYFLFFRNRNQVRDLPRILKSGRITVVTENSNIGFAVNNDSVRGFQYEIIKAFADTLGVELQISTLNDVRKSLEGVEDGEYDLMANMVPVTDDIPAKLVFSDPLMTSRLMLVQYAGKKDSADQKIIEEQYDLAGKDVYLPLNSPFRSRISHLAQEIGDTIRVYQYKDATVEMMVKFVAEGKIPNTVCPEEATNKFALLYPQLDMSLPIGFTQNYSWVVNKKSKKLEEKLNAFLDDFIGSTAYWELYHRYFN